METIYEVSALDNEIVLDVSTDEHDGIFVAECVDKETCEKIVTALNNHKTLVDIIDVIKEHDYKVVPVVRKSIEHLLTQLKKS